MKQQLPVQVTPLLHRVSLQCPFAKSSTRTLEVSVKVVVNSLRLIPKPKDYLLCTASRDESHYFHAIYPAGESPLAAKWLLLYLDRHIFSCLHCRMCQLAQNKILKRPVSTTFECTSSQTQYEEAGTLS